MILDLTNYREYLRKKFAESFVSCSSDQDPIIGFLEAVALSPKHLKPNEVMKGSSSGPASLSVLAKHKYALKSGKNSILHIKVNFKMDAS
ncbi:hypothetical protein PHYBLDRAFT_139409 [Phycomyces blakesleeanus NRRL 1555(-)]|uniref:Uncharacterized protein n=1 Tax=Phycomyces blakesleeanus (strain ATCC 8743b / DSM 1359 / FGSC 10004 / NBRC 33097 / NRRL 1555) TaxID=763407 RepID=A0A167QAS4_PHYB8|nr:hypothetical protein PHYBLDRAFT_139409 [Phycomyces blakesleeanus NRRL 1555(-)]OAD79379.1 hypothetical protein PHYBLDRAFT_139409 [Phycomyces blakesleeanus NRRL 1555(-)]|eukprot:XP_018297419.1 hypothetical protein PHYBLDRAFT_139409 [Phycomyces blakesleeanus NRRL 1555(-)]